MKWVALLSLFVFVCAQDYNLTSIPFVIPGADFVGYGFDIRYLATEHAVRFPLVDWTYSVGKTYVYPLNRDDVYLVPDQLYVRTVARTDAESYVFSTLDEVKKTESESHGVKGESTGEIDPFAALPAANRTALYGQWMSKYSNISNGAISIIPQTVVLTNKAFSLGAEMKFAESALSKNENYIVKNKQVNQLYQLFLDKRPLRKALELDMMKLIGAEWFSSKEMYQSFFERYGTHVVVSAMLGGAISLDSVVQRTAIQTITTVVNNFTQQTNQSHVDSKNETVSDTLERDNPLCNGTFAGYGYNPFTKKCELLPEAWCYAPMDDVFSEKFDSYSGEKTAKPWSALGPKEVPSSGSELQCTWIDECYPYWSFWFWRYWYCYSVQRCVWIKLPPYSDPVINITTIPIADCPTCKALYIDNAGLPYSRAQIGQYKDFSTQPNPQLISFYVYTSANNNDNNIVDIVDTKDQTNANDDFSFIQFAVSNGKFGLRTNSGTGSKLNNGISYIVGTWYEIRLSLDYTAETVDFWYRRAADSQLLLGVKAHKFFESDSRDAYRVGRVMLYNSYSGTKGTWSNFRFCNPTSGPPYKPLTTHTAVATTTAKFKQVVSGKLDTTFENTYNKFTIYQSNNWKLKGGDSSMVDLLNFKQSTDVFEAWKVTIQGNPAPVQFTLKEISALFPDVNTTNGISQRDLVKTAIKLFLTEETVLDPIIDTKLTDSILN